MLVADAWQRGLDQPVKATSMMLKERWGEKNVVCTYVSLSSHDRHVSFTVPCKTEADGGISVRNLYVFFFFKEVRSAGHVGTTIHSTARQPTNFPHFPPPSLVVHTHKPKNSF